jgi:predicted transcriptional regulator with HTH domain
VHELRGGSSNIAFDYRIMAKRNGFENVRLADVTKKSQEMDQQQKTLRERMAQRHALQAEPKR